jgi:mannosyltransferase
MADYHSTRRDYGWLPVLFGLLALAAGLGFRLWRIDGYPLWLDEAYSAFAADRGFAFLWHVVPRYDSHPPFYYTLVHLWRLAAGQGLLAARLPGLLCGIATIMVAAMAARRIATLTRIDRAQARWLVAASVALVALQPLLIAMSRQLRPYPVMILVYAIGLLGLLRLIEDDVLRRATSRRAMVLVFASQAMMLWLHALGPLFALALGLAGLAAVLRPGLGVGDWAWLIGGELVVALIYLPALLITLGEAGSWAQATWLHFTPSTLPTTIGQIYLDWNLWARLVGLAAGVAGVMLLSRRIGGWRVTTVLLLLAVVPVAVSILVSMAAAPVFLDRTLSPAAVPALLIVATGLAWPGRWAWLALLPLAVILGSMAEIDRSAAITGPQQDWYRTIDWLAPQVRGGDTVWAYPNDGALPLGYALRDRRQGLPVRPIPAAVPALTSAGNPAAGVRGVVSLHPGQIAALMAEPETKRPPTIWLLRLNYFIYDPGDPMLHALERDRVVVAHFRRGPIDVTGLRRKDLPPVATAQQAQP